MGAEEEVDNAVEAVGKVPDPPVIEEPLPPLPKFGAIVGSAGTGKTTLIKKILARRRDAVVSATTGVAAINTGGTTIHSRLGYYDLFSLQLAAKSGKLVKNLLSYFYRGTRVWIVDEVSMMGGDQLQIIATAIDEANKKIQEQNAEDSYAAKLAGTDHSISMVLVGDPCQLPPVNAPWFFESEAWKDKFAGNINRLTKVYRQTDLDFIGALRDARSGHGPGALAFFRNRIHPRRDDDFGGLTIMATNKEVDEENARKLALCTGREVRFTNHKEGEPHRLKDWKAIPEELVLKEGAKVMILANYRTREEGLVYVNGDIGELRGVTGTTYDTETGETIDHEDKLPIVVLERNGKTVIVEPATRDVKVPWDRATDKEQAEYHAHLEERKKSARGTIERYNKHLDLAVDDFERLQIERDLDLEQKLLDEMESGATPDYLTVAWMTYTPLRLAYASTVHKCVAVGTRIPTSSGLIDVEFIEDGNAVYSGNAYVDVQATAPSKRKAWRITTGWGYDLTCAPDHPIQTEHGFVPAAELTTDDKVRVVNMLPETHRTAGDLDLCYLLGMLVGDGSYNDQEEGQLHFCSQDEHLCNRFVGILADNKIHARIRSDKRGAHATSKAFREKLLDWGLGYATARYKEVPQACRFDRLGAIEFLRGLFDTDGGVYRSGVVFCTTSRSVGKDVQLLLLALEIPSKRACYAGVNGPYWQLRVGAFGLARFKKLIGFERPYKRDALEACIPNRIIGTWDGWDTVKNVEDLGVSVQMIDLEVSGEHTFVADGIVTHNCQGLTLDRIQIDLASGFWTMCPGSLYVALSRARTPEGIRIVGSNEKFLARCRSDWKVRSFV